MFLSYTNPKYFKLFYTNYTPYIIVQRTPLKE